MILGVCFPDFNRQFFCRQTARIRVVYLKRKRVAAGKVTYGICYRQK